MSFDRGVSERGQTGPADKVSVTLTWLQGEALVLVVGELDGLSSEPLRRRLEEALAAGVRRIVVDLSGVTALGGDALHELRLTAGSLRERGGDLLLVDPAPGVRRLLRHLGTDGSVRIARLGATGTQGPPSWARGSAAAGPSLSRRR